LSEFQPADRCGILLVGAGVVGRAIAAAHLDAGVSIRIADRDEACLREAVSQLTHRRDRWQVSPPFRLGQHLRVFALSCQAGHPTSPSAPIVIESITEKLETKQVFFEEAERLLSDDAVLCTNTSTLRISTLAGSLARPERFCGMHFFMPVKGRAAVEVVGGERTTDATITQCMDHVRRIGKQPLVVGDGPGFLVNRLLSPYLNEAMLLLGRGVTAGQIQRAALAYGMPMSPLELIDLIGTRTMFDAGRVYWQSFPSRLSPSPMLASLVKNKRLGRACDAGLYDYADGRRSDDLSPITLEFCEKYRRDEVSMGDDEVMRLLSIPMWIEAALAYRDGVASSPEQFNLAMSGGLGFQSAASWLDFFDSLGSQAILDTVARWSPVTACMKAPDRLLSLLAQSAPTAAMEQFAN
jgi:3-hydroxyacyl-CoA dehydrogenase